MAYKKLGANRNPGRHARFGHATIKFCCQFHGMQLFRAIRVILPYSSRRRVLPVRQVRSCQPTNFYPPPPGFPNCGSSTGQPMLSSVDPWQIEGQQAFHFSDHKTENNSHFIHILKWVNPQRTVVERVLKKFAVGFRFWLGNKPKINRWERAESSSCSCTELVQRQNR